MSSILKNLSLKAKIVGNSGILIALLILSASYAIYAMSGIGRELKNVATEDIPLTEHVSELSALQLKQTIAFERARRFGPHLNEQRASRSFEDAVAAFDDGSAKTNDHIDKAERLLQSVIDHSSESALKKVASVSRMLRAIDEQQDQFAHRAQSVFDAYSDGRSDAADSLATPVYQDAVSLDERLHEMALEISTFTDSSALIALAHEESALRVLTILAVLSLAFGLIVSWIVSSAIVGGIQKAIVTASGDLTQNITVDSRDEIGQLLEAMNGLRQKLLNMISQISGTTSQLASASEQMSVVTNQTSQTIDEQHSETAQLATAMNEMSATAQDVATNVSQAATAVGEASKHSSQGRQTVQKTMEQIQRLADDVEVSAQAIGEVDKYSETISTVVDVIKGIAEQTNLLALNAAIEAARAGEQGRGFAVVADEVRALASRTRQSTDEINDMISKLQSVSRKAVESMANNKSQVEKTVEYAGQAGIALQTIDTAMDQINAMSAQIASASEQQVGVAENINTNIDRINAMSNQTAEGAEETAAASRDLTRMATELQTLVGQFQV